MTSMYRKIGLVKMGIIVAAVAAVLAGSVIAMASGVDIRPEKDTLLITSTSPVTFTAGGVTISCEPAQTTGTIPSPLASSMEIERSLIGTCSTSGEGASTNYVTGKSWELVAKTTTSAGLVVGADTSFEKINSKCRLYLTTAREPVVGTWTTGTKMSPLAKPASKLTITGAVFPGEIEREKGEKCPKLEEGSEVNKEGITVTKVKMSGTFVVNDTTHLNEPVELK